MNSKNKNSKLLADNCSTTRNFEQLFKKSKLKTKIINNKLFDKILINSSNEKKKISLFDV